MSSASATIRSAILLAALSVFAQVADADDSLVCGNSLVRVGMTADEVVGKCGEPKDRAGEDRPVYARTPAGGTVQTGTYRVERWTYDRGNSRFPAVFTFEEGKLKSIELVTR